MLTKLKGISNPVIKLTSNIENPNDNTKLSSAVVDLDIS